MLAQFIFDISNCNIYLDKTLRY